MSDHIAQLRVSVQKGDNSALSELLDMHDALLRRIIQLRLDPRLKGRVSCSDVVQDVCLDALKRIDQLQLKPNMPFHLWIRMLATQRLVDLHRQHLGAKKRDAAMEVSLDGNLLSQVSSVALARIFTANTSTPSQELARKEVFERVTQAFEEMEPLDREILSMRHFEDLSNMEVSTVLGITTAAASKRYVRALRKLKTALAKFES